LSNVFDVKALVFSERFGHSFPVAVTVFNRPTADSNEPENKLKLIMKLPHFLSLATAALLLPLANPASAATIIDIQGSVDGTGPDEFADYSGLSKDADITPPSTVTDGDYSLTVGGFGPLVDWGGSSNIDGSEIDFQAGGASEGVSTADSAADAFTMGTYFEVSLASTGLNFDWDSLSATIWRNGGAAAETYQFAYADDGNWDTTDLLGTAQTFTTDGSSNLETVSYTGNIVSDAASATARLYFWDATNTDGNTHLTNVEAQFSPIPEPSAMTLLLGGLLAFVTIRRRRR
jgi:hypothetical protein